MTNRLAGLFFILLSIGLSLQSPITREELAKLVDKVWPKNIPKAKDEGLLGIDSLVDSPLDDKNYEASHIKRWQDEKKIEDLVEIVPWKVYPSADKKSKVPLSKKNDGKELKYLNGEREVKKHPTLPRRNPDEKINKNKRNN